MLLIAIGLGVSATEAYLPPLYGGTVSAPLTEVPLDLQPATAQRASERQLGALLFDQLYDCSGDKPLPHLARALPTLSERGLIWRVPLRQGVLRHDGLTLSAKDVAASLKQVFKGPHAFLFAQVKSIGSKGGDEILFAMKRRGAQLFPALCAPATAVAIRNGEAWVGSGPFYLAEQARGRWLLKAHLKHFAGRPYLDELQFRVFDKLADEAASYQVGSSQISRRGTSVFGGQPRHAAALEEGRASDTVFVAFGKKKPFLADSLFRRAIQAAIDRDRLARLAGSGRTVVADGPVAAALSPQSKRAPSTFDRALANTLLARVATRRPELQSAAAEGKVPLALTIDNSRPADRLLAGQIISDLDRIGIIATIDAVSAAEFAAKLVKGDFALAVDHYLPQLPDEKTAVAGAWARAAEPGLAASCAVSRKCAVWHGRFVKDLPLLPLVNAAHRVHYDKRLGGMRVSQLSLIAFERLFWRRAR